MSLHDSFNHSAFSHFINSTSGRVFRIVAGLAFLAAGYAYRAHPLGIVSMVWSIFPLTAGAFDWCYVSGVLGGPIAGARIRAQQSASPKP